MRIVCLCHTCARQHPMDFDPRIGPGAGFSDWLEKHPEGHDTEFVWPERSGKTIQPANGWLHYLHNANVKVSYASSANATITLASLASSSTLLTGRQGTAIDNTTNLYLDYFYSGKITVGTTPTVNTNILACLVGMLDDSTWPDAFGASDAGVTVTSGGIFNSICQVAANLQVDSTTSNRAYPFGPIGVKKLFNNAMPAKFVPFIVHNTGVALNSTGGNQQVTLKGTFATVA